MEEISITEKIDTPTGWQFSVTLGTDPDTTSHTVTLDQTYWQKLTAGKITPEDLVKKSFAFLLEREPKESILSHFDLPVINTYFPEYEQTIAGNL
jgi:hypothetical protein